MSLQLPPYVDVAIVGAGVSGISMVHHLHQHHPQRSYVVLEARSATGGTWDQFRYPGIRSDSDLQTFGYRFKPWTGHKSLASGPDILDYIREAAEEAQLGDQLRLNVKVESADWSSDDLSWHLTVRDTGTGEAHTMRCGWLATAAGFFDQDRGYVPEFEGREDFTGPFIHPQTWPEDLDIEGKQVVVIGSGATAVTLVPALTEQGAQVTMLQRSPGYILPYPDVDHIANVLRRLFGDRIGHAITRWKNVQLYTNFYRLSQRKPRWVRAMIRRIQRHWLGDDYDYDTHLNPSYNPWDERTCLVPNGDLLAAVAAGTAEIVTDHVDRLVPEGVRLKSGRVLDADIIVSATGFKMQPIGGIRFSVDGVAKPVGERYTFRGVMLDDLPNMSYVIGYVTNSWTLKSDLVAEHVMRVLSYLDDNGLAAVVARAPEGMTTQPFVDFMPGYVQRSWQAFPKQGDQEPWAVPLLYVHDAPWLRNQPIASRYLEHIRRPAPVVAVDAVAEAVS
ncbi:flavin-containing monooxygenase [Mycolicibacterium sp. XJ1819]